MDSFSGKRTENRLFPLGAVSSFMMSHEEQHGKVRERLGVRSIGFGITNGCEVSRSSSLY